MTAAGMERGLEARLARMDGLVRQLEALPDEGARAAAREVVELTMALHGEGLTRMLALGRESWAGDDLLRSLFLLHGIHPEPVERRIEQALGQVRPYIESHGGSVELLGVEGGVARLRMAGRCKTCPSSTVTIRTSIEGAVYELAPELKGIEVEGVT